MWLYKTGPQNQACLGGDQLSSGEGLAENLPLSSAQITRPLAPGNAVATRAGRAHCPVPAVLPLLSNGKPGKAEVLTGIGCHGPDLGT